MTDHDGRNYWYQYKVTATVEFAACERTVSETTLDDVESRWLDEKERAVNLAQRLRDDGHSVEIRTRRRGDFAPKDFDEIPENGGA